MKIANSNFSLGYGLFDLQSASFGADLYIFGGHSKRNIFDPDNVFNKTVWKSSDGVNWEIVSTTSNFPEGVSWSVLKSGSTVYCLSRGNMTTKLIDEPYCSYLYTSTDCINWTKVTHNFPDNVETVQSIEGDYTYRPSDVKLVAYKGNVYAAGWYSKYGVKSNVSWPGSVYIPYFIYNGPSNPYGETIEVPQYHQPAIIYNNVPAEENVRAYLEYGVEHLNYLELIQDELSEYASYGLWKSLQGDIDTPDLADTSRATPPDYTSNTYKTWLKKWVFDRVKETQKCPPTQISYNGYFLDPNNIESIGTNLSYDTTVLIDDVTSYKASLTKSVFSTCLEFLNAWYIQSIPVENSFYVENSGIWSNKPPLDPDNVGGSYYLNTGCNLYHIDGFGANTWSVWSNWPNLSTQQRYSTLPIKYWVDGQVRELTSHTDVPVEATGSAITSPGNSYPVDIAGNFVGLYSNTFDENNSYTLDSPFTGNSNLYVKSGATTKGYSGLDWSSSSGVFTSLSLPEYITYTPPNELVVDCNDEGLSQNQQLQCGNDSQTKWVALPEKDDNNNQYLYEVFYTNLFEQLVARVPYQTSSITPNLLPQDCFQQTCFSKDLYYYGETAKFAVINVLTGEEFLNETASSAIKEHYTTKRAEIYTNTDPTLTDTSATEGVAGKLYNYKDARSGSFQSFPWGVPVIHDGNLLLISSQQSANPNYKYNEDVYSAEVLKVNLTTGELTTIGTLGTARMNPVVVKDADTIYVCFGKTSSGYCDTIEKSTDGGVTWTVSDMFAGKGMECATGTLRESDYKLFIFGGFSGSEE